LSGLFAAIIVFLTTVSVVAFGIFAAYALVNAILFAFAQSREQKRGAPVLIPSQTHASGD
jgi:hypothetical protein